MNYSSMCTWTFLQTQENVLCVLACVFIATTVKTTELLHLL